MTLPKILLQLDSDSHASVFDSVVAIDAGIDQLLCRGGVEPIDVRDLVHGAMFTRGPQDLRHTAIFIGGADVGQGEVLLEQTLQCFFGPMRVSVMLDANGANTTASAAVLAAARHVPLAGATATVLAGTGPVGERAVRLLAGAGATVRVGSRRLDRSQAVCDKISAAVKDAALVPCETSNPAQLTAALQGAEVVIAAGAAGVELLDQPTRAACQSLQVAIDLNAVPPVGIAGIEVTDKGVDQQGVICYGAIGVGGTKMKIHKAALARLFQSNDQVLDAEQIFEIGKSLEG